MNKQGYVLPFSGQLQALRVHVDINYQYFCNSSSFHYLLKVSMLLYSLFIQC